MPETEIPTFVPGRRWRIGFNVLISTAALLSIVLMGNYLSARHFRRFDPPAGRSDQLSPVTLRILQTLTNQVKVTVFFGGRNVLLDPVLSLLRQYEQSSPRIEVERIDYERYPGRARQLLATLKQDAGIESDRILFSSGGRTKIVFERELSQYDHAAEAVMAGREIKRTGFLGEQLFTAAIFSVTDPKPLKAYYLTGHGEHDPTEPSENSLGGYGKFDALLAENNLSRSSVALNEGEVPEDCNLLIVAGASKALPRSELASIDRYLQRGGRALFLLSFFALDNQRTGLDVTGLPQLLANWGVDAGQNVVNDGGNSLGGAHEEMAVSNFGSHPIVSPLLRSRVGLLVPRSVSQRQGAFLGADAPKVTELFVTGPNAFAVRQGANPQFLVRDRALPLAVAVEKGAIQGITTDKRTTRIVVVGDSHLLGNKMIDHEANRDFARNAVNWLVSREVLIEGIGPRKISEYRINMTGREMQAVRWIMLAGMPGTVIFIGWIVWLRRRS